MSETIRYLSDVEAPRFLPGPAERVRLCEAALAALTRKADGSDAGFADLPPKLSVAVGRGGAFAHAMPAAVELDGRRLVGMKWISGDPDAPPPNIGGAILLERPGGTGLAAIVAAAGLTGARTAAVSMAALRAVPPRTPHVAQGAAWRVVFVGGGVQAASHREALAAEVPDARVRFVTRRPASDLPLRPGDEAVGPDALTASLTGADVVITSVAFGTAGRELDPDRIVPGATLIATDYATAVTARTLAGIGRHGPSPSDLPRLIVDDAAQFDATRGAGKLPGYRPADATLGALIADPEGLGRRVRERPVGTTVVVNHLGVAVCDLAIGWGVVQAAERAGAGLELPR
jgi:ornithine cyclodeaminase